MPAVKIRELYQSIPIVIVFRGSSSCNSNICRFSRWMSLPFENKYGVFEDIDAEVVLEYMEYLEVAHKRQN